MFKFAFGLSTGIVVGAVGTFVAGIFTVIAIEDSPEILKTIKEIYAD